MIKAVNEKGADKYVEQFSDNVLRPSSFDEYIGQSQIKKNLSILIGAAKARGLRPSLPPGPWTARLAGPCTFFARAGWPAPAMPVSGDA